MLIELSKFALDCKVAHVSGRELVESCEKQTKKYKKTSFNWPRHATGTS